MRRGGASAALPQRRVVRGRLRCRRPRATPPRDAYARRRCLSRSRGARKRAPREVYLLPALFLLSATLLKLAAADTPLLLQAHYLPRRRAASSVFTLCCSRDAQGDAPLRERLLMSSFHRFCPHSRLTPRLFIRSLHAATLLPPPRAMQSLLMLTYGAYSSTAMPAAPGEAVSFYAALAPTAAASRAAMPFLQIISSPVLLRHAVRGVRPAFSTRA